MSIVLFVVGLGLLLVGAEVLVRGATQLAAAIGISPLVVGLTVVAFGTSSPELAISVQSAFNGQADLALGNVVGSNIANVLLILGISALITPLTVAQRIIRLDVPLMLGCAVLVLLMGLDGQIGRLDGAVLFLGLLAYTGFAIVQSRRESAAVTAEYRAEYGADARAALKRWPLHLVQVLVGLVCLTIGAGWLVDGAVELARLLGLSELIIGLTVIAIGTSLPEVAASVVASVRGERDIAVGNVVGSSIFNVLSVLGLSALIAPRGVAVSMPALRFDIPVMIAVALACLPIFINGGAILRWEGALFLAYYAFYTLYLVLNATQHALLPVFSGVMLSFVIPLTVVTLLVLMIRQLRQPPAVPR